MVYDLIKRPKIKLKDILSYYFDERFDDEVIEGLEIEIKYEGYIQKAFKEVTPKDVINGILDKKLVDGWFLYKRLLNKNIKKYFNN